LNRTTEVFWPLTLCIIAAPWSRGYLVLKRDVVWGQKRYNYRKHAA
jgi:hypothetical protein